MQDESTEMLKSMYEAIISFRKDTSDKFNEVNMTLGGINEHLKTLNHRTEKSENRLTIVEKCLMTVDEWKKGLTKQGDWVGGIVSNLIEKGVWTIVVVFMTLVVLHFSDLQHLF